MSGDENNNNSTILMATGASGGHVLPALAVAKQLHTQGVECVFVMGGHKMVDVVENQGFNVLSLPAAPWNGQNIVGKIKAFLCFIGGFLAALGMVRKYRPAVVYGGGGYASVALLLAGKLLKIPTVIHEQNVTFGRANKFLCRFADKILLSHEKTLEFSAKYKQKCVVCGNPVREEIAAVANQPYPEKSERINLLVIGGSQGARVLSQIVPEAADKLLSFKARLHISHQARPEDVEMVKQKYAVAGFGEDQLSIAEFFMDMPERLKNAHVLVSRAGAGTLAEAAVVGRPLVLVPLGQADGHQKHNAALFYDAGAAKVIEEKNFKAANLAHELETLLSNKVKLPKMAEAAGSLGQPEAAKLVAQQVNELMAGRSPVVGEQDNVKQA